MTNLSKSWSNPDNNHIKSWEKSKSQNFKIFWDLYFFTTVSPFGRQKVTVFPSLFYGRCFLCILQLLIEIQDQVKKWRPNSWNVTHSYRWLFSNKFFIFAFFVEISTATPHQHPCRTFVLVFGMTLEIKNLRKTIFEFYQFPVKIILVGLCLKALNSIEKLHHPS